MENKINLAAILKDCPRGMELDCSIHTRPVIFNCVKMKSDYPIRISSNDGFSHSLTYWGSLYNCEDAKCVIFPKGETTWEGFHRPFKDGDIVATMDGSWIGITEGGKKGIFIPTYCVIKSGGVFEVYFDRKEKWAFDRLATKEEKQKLFQAIKDNGYKWNAETKTLEKLVEPKFKVGDRIRRKNSNEEYTIISISAYTYYYRLDEHCTGSLGIQLQDDYELVPNKFDIATLIPFESRVLVRDSSVGVWLPEFFGCLCDSDDCPYMIIGGTRWKYCIPFEGNEHLLGKVEDCKDFYKIWE